MGGIKPSAGLPVEILPNLHSSFYEIAGRDIPIHAETDEFAKLYHDMQPLTFIENNDPHLWTIQSTYHISFRPFVYDRDSCRHIRTLSAHILRPTTGHSNE